MPALFYSVPLTPLQATVAPHLHQQLLDTPRLLEQASLAQSLLVGSLFLSPGSWCAQGFVCALQEDNSAGICPSEGCLQRWRSSMQSVKTRPEADCGSDHEFLIAKFRL